MNHDYLVDFRRGDLDRLNLAAGVILSEPYAITPALAAELVAFKKRVERALLLPDADAPGGDEWPGLLDPGMPAPLVLIDPSGSVRPLGPEDMTRVTAAIKTLHEYCLLVDHAPGS